MREIENEAPSAARSAALASKSIKPLEILMVADGVLPSSKSESAKIIEVGVSGGLSP